MAAPSGSFLAGKNSRVRSSGQDLTANTWSATYNGIDLDVTNFESNGFDEGIKGVEKLTWSLDAAWNTAQNPNDDPPGLFPTDGGTDLIMYVNTADADGYNMPLYRVFNGTAGATAKGNVTFRADGCSQGTFTAP